MELIDFFDRGATRWSKEACFVAGELSLAYRDVRAATMRIAAALRAGGCEPGLHFAVLTGDEPVGVICALGALRAHLVWVPVSTSGSTESLTESLDWFDCDVVFSSPEFSEVVETLAKRRPDLHVMLCPTLRSTDDVCHLQDWLSEFGEDFEIAPAAVDDVAAIIPTGGTTGRPKGAIHTHLDFQIRVASHLAMLPVEGRPRYMLGSPAPYLASLHSFQMFARGGTGYFTQTQDPRQLAAEIEHHQLTDVSLPVTLLYMLLADPEARKCDLRSVQHLIYATAPMSEAKLRDTIDAFGPVVAQVYSQTETLAYITHLSAEDHVVDGHVVSDERLRSCGREAPLMKVAVMAPDGRICKPGELGEIVVRGASIMSGYYKNPDETARVSLFGWHHTGDAGYYDDERFFYIVDRLADLITVDDEQVAPSEIERAIMDHPAVRDCAVVGLPDETLGRHLTAVVELAPEASATTVEILRTVARRLPPLKVPKELAIWDELPRSPRGKVLRRAVYEHLMEA